MNRRQLLLGAAVAAVAPATACALPPRLLQDDAPKLNLIPCDGRELPIAYYEELWDGLGRPRHHIYRQTFLLPNMGPMQLGERTLHPFVIPRGHHAGTVRYVERS